MTKLHHDFAKLLEPNSFKAVESDDEHEVAIVASAAISLKRIADASEKLNEQMALLIRIVPR